MKYFTSTPVCLETSCFQREVNTSSRLQENISLACQLLLFQLDWRAASCSHTLFVWSGCRRQMRAMRVVAFVVYFKSGLFSGKKKKSWNFHMEKWCGLCHVGSLYRWVVAIHPFLLWQVSAEVWRQVTLLMLMARPWTHCVDCLNVSVSQCNERTISASVISSCGTNCY